MRPIHAATLSCLLAAPAVAQDVKHLGTFTDWNAFQQGAGRARVCHMASQPKASEGNVPGRREAFVTVAHGPGPKNGVVSIVAGYAYRKDSTVKLDVDGKEYTLFTDQDRAWTYTDQDDRTLLEAMVKGRQLIVQGTPARGATTTDTYSLSGVSKALEAIDAACQVKR